MLNLILTSLLMAAIGQTTPDAPSPGALRLLRTANALETSSVAPLRQRTVAGAWIATATAAIGGEPPQGPPDSVTATPELMATWANACIDAAATGPLDTTAVAYAEVQAETIIRLLSDVDATGTEPPDPKALAGVFLLAGELALADGNTTAAREYAQRSAATLDWHENLTIEGASSLGMLLARLHDTASISKLADGIPASQLPELVAASASQPGCASVTAALMKNPALLEGGRSAHLLHELNLVHASEATSLLLSADPSITKNPALLLLAVQTFLSDGKTDEGLDLLGGKASLEKLRGRDLFMIRSAMAMGQARNGEFAAAKALIQQLGRIDARFFVLVELQSRMLAKGDIPPAKVLGGIDTLRSVRTTALDPLLPTIASRPTRLDRVMEAVVASERFALAATLLTPLFAPGNQTGDDWLDRRIALLARALAHSAPLDDQAWETLIRSIPWCARIDCQVRAMASIAMCWNMARPKDALPASIREALSATIEAIATGNNERQR